MVQHLGTLKVLGSHESPACAVAPIREQNFPTANKNTLPCVLVASVAVQIVAASKSTHSHNIYCATDKRGTRTVKLNAEAGTCDARLRPWYKEAVAPNKPIWTSIYPGFTSGTVFIAASQPIRGRNGKLLGVSAVDFSLSEIQQYLDRIKLSKTRQIFAIERSGLVVANSRRLSCCGI